MPPDPAPAFAPIAAPDLGDQNRNALADVTAGGEFTPGRDQVAPATIRGFVYQVELTILRWLGLGADQVLQLERSEDIDHITRAPAARAA